MLNFIVNNRKGNSSCHDVRENQQKQQSQRNVKQHVERPEKARKREKEKPKAKAEDVRAEREVPLKWL
jgi:hypothetical protein